MNRVIVNFLWCCLFELFFSSGLQAQKEAFFYQLKQSSGEVLETVYSIDQNDDYSLNFYTDQGIFIYNGNELRKRKTSSTFSEEEFFGGYEDSKGRKWARTLSGKTCFWKDGKFYFSDNEPICDQLDFQSILVKILEGDQGYYFFSSINGIKRLSHNNEVEWVNSTLAVISAVEISGDEFLIITRDGLYLQEGDNLRMIDSIELSNHYALGINHYGKIYMSYYNQLFEFDPNKESLNLLETFDAEIINIQEFDTQTLVISTRAGAHFWNAQQQSKVTYLKQYAISSFFQDVQGNYWFSTLKHGLFFTPDLTKVRVVAEGINQRSIYALSKDKKGRLWIGLDSSEVMVYDGERVIRQIAFPGNRKNNAITKIKSFDDQDGVFVLGKNFFSHIQDDSLIQTAAVGGNDFEFDEQSNLWVISVQLYCFGQLDGVFEDVDEKSNTYSKSLKRGNAIRLTDKQIFVGTQYGAYQVQKDSLFLHNSIDQRVSCISDSFLLTSDGSLFRYLINSKQYEFVFNTNVRYPNVMKEVGNKIYIGSKSGLAVLNLNTLEIRKHQLFNQINVLSIEKIDSTLFLGTKEGLFELNLPKNYSVKPPILAIDSILVQSGKLNQQMNSFQLGFKQKEVLFYLKSINYLGEVSCLMKVNSQDWIDVPAIVRYNLNEGNNEFSFQLQAKNGLSSEIIKKSFYVAPPFWRRWWFYLLVSLLLLLIISRIIVLIIKKIRKENEMLRQIENRKYEKLKSEKRIIELEQKALRLQMNPHFVFNAINTIKGLYAQRKEREASLYIGSFSRFLRSILENKDTPVNLVEELEELKNYVEMNKVNFDRLTLKIQYPETLNVRALKIPNLLLQPFLENAIIHGFNHRKEGTILIDIKECKDNDNIQISVVDNGNGLEKKSKHLFDSKGIQLSIERLELFNEGLNHHFSIANRGEQNGVKVTFNLKKVE